MSFVDAQHGWVVALPSTQGAAANLDVTTDGGRTWSVVGTLPAASGWGLAFATPTDGYARIEAVTDTLLVTHDGGRSFTPSPLPGPPLALLPGVTEDIAVAGVCDGKGSCNDNLYGSTDRGRRWAHRATFNNVPDVTGLVRDRGALVLLTGDTSPGTHPHAQLFASTDNGATWSTSSSPCGDGLYSALASGPTGLWVECASLQTGGYSLKQIYRSSDRKTWQLVADNTKDQSQPQNPPIPFGGEYGVLAVADDAHAALGTSRGNVVVTADGGANWTAAPGLPTDAELFVSTVQFADAQHGWASIEVTTDSPNNGVYRTDDGGRTWTLVRIP
jgi:photosystem II stability/assembly factor-like uncharacterized protein